MHNEGMPRSARLASRRSPHAGLRRFAVLATCLAVSLGGPGCARPYRGPKTLAAVGASVLVGSAVLWAVGDRAGSRPATRVGLVGATLGAALAASAGAWLAGSAGCHTDPDCPEGEACREIPAPPGREPYKQCMPR
jgi:hypothetical protein